MARYIDADKLIEMYKEAISHDWNKKVAPVSWTDAFECTVEDIEAEPTVDVVEVVRCKDCGSYNKDYGECTLNGSHFGENGYCCKGTRIQNDFKEN